MVRVGGEVVSDKKGRTLSELRDSLPPERRKKIEARTEELMEKSDNRGEDYRIAPELLPKHSPDKLEIERLRADLLTADGQNMELSARLATAERLLRDVQREMSDFDGRWGTLDEIDAFHAGASDE